MDFLDVIIDGYADDLLSLRRVILLADGHTIGEVARGFDRAGVAPALSATDGITVD